MPSNDTIAAISTAPGRGGIGIVRLSGPEAVEIAGKLCRFRHPLAPGHARFGHLIDATGATLDEVVATLFAAPHSYTTEDVVELALHGAPVLLDQALRLAITHGARLAAAGEFTERAFLAGRLDLTQAEAVNDLISAHTLEQARAAAAQLGGSVARAVTPAQQQLINLIAELEAGVDFAEDDLDLLPDDAIAARIDAVSAPLRILATTGAYGRTLREGFSLAIVGAPNAGKSSLFNALLGRARAIVTAQPGTTRDLITESLAIAGIPVELIDTAGLRDIPGGEAESAGIALSHQVLADADLVLLCAEAPAAALDRLLDQVSGRRYLVVQTKCDLAPRNHIPHAIATSALESTGLATLRSAIVAQLAGAAPAAESALLTNQRQQQAVGDAVAALDRAREASNLAHELLLLDLYAALAALGSLTQATSQEEILAAIFSRFCIGK